MGRISIWEAQIDMGGSLTSGKNSTTVVSTTEGYGIKSGLSQNVNMVFAKPISSSSASLSRYISIGKLHAYYAQNSIIGNDFASIFIILCHTKSFSQELKVFIETNSRNEFIDRKKKKFGFQQSHSHHSQFESSIACVYIAGSLYKYICENVLTKWQLNRIWGRTYENTFPVSCHVGLKKVVS